MDARKCGGGVGFLIRAKAYLEHGPKLPISTARSKSQFARVA
jgi:hypothetical protein